MLIDIVGNSIRILRKAQNMSIEDLAYLCGIDASHLGKIERGQHNPSLETLRKFAAAVKLSLSELIRGGVDDGPDIIDAFVSELFPYPNINNLEMYDPLLLLDNLGKIVLEKLTLLDIERIAFGTELDKVYSLVKSHMDDPELGRYISFGISASFGEKTITIDNICCNQREVEKLVNSLNKMQIPEYQFPDAVEDFVQGYLRVQ